MTLHDSAIQARSASEGTLKKLAGLGGRPSLALRACIAGLARNHEKPFSGALRSHSATLQLPSGTICVLTVAR